MNIKMLGTKLGMTQIFDETGAAVPVTVIHVGPCSITYIKTLSKHGYSALQIGYLNISPTRLTKPLREYFNHLNVSPFKYLDEYKTNKIDQYKIGDSITVKQFTQGQLITISGVTIGKGFTGYQKRHNFSRGPMSHGSKNHRTPGSIGAGTTPGRVLPRTKMAGRSGARKISVPKLKIMRIDAQNNILVVKGSIPGKPGNVVSITPQ
nr:ribosomal protein L3 [Sciadococcus taiwanensis]